MKTNPNDPANPTPYINQDGTIQHDVYLGLSKRERMAMEFTKAFISIQYDCTDTCVKYGISAADKLIEALNKEEQ